jgi:polyhydroxyalkanoate synthesis regulator phasin
MKKLILILWVFILPLSLVTKSQDLVVMLAPEETKKPAPSTGTLSVYEFRTSLTEQQIREISAELVEKHDLGELVSKKFYLLDEKYTYEMPLVPGNPQSKTMVRKPVIYESVFKIEKYLKKSVKKGEMTLENAATIMHKVLDVANCIVTIDSSSFEKEINQRKNPEALTQLFMNQVKLVN